MTKGSQRFSLLGIMVFTGLLLAACQPEEQLIAPAVPGINVAISGQKCPGVLVKAGDQVTWTNLDRREHIVHHLPEEGESLFSSGILKPQDTFAFTFVEPGTYPYNCTTSGAETGSVIVEP